MNRRVIALARVIVLGLVVVGARRDLASAAAMKVMSGTIRSVDRSRATVAIRPQSPAASTDQTFRIGPKTVIAVGPDAADLAQLEAGRKVTVFYDPDTRVISKLLLTVAPGGRPGPPAGGEAGTMRTVLRPSFSNPGTAAGRLRGDSEYVLDLAPGKSVRAVLTYEVTMPGISASEWVLCAPRPPELPGQRNVHAVLSPGGVPVRDLSSSPRPLLLARVPADRADRQTTIAARAEYEATLVARHLRRRQPDEKAPSFGSVPTAVQQAALRSGGSFDLDAPAFRRWLAENQVDRRRPDEGSIDYARRVFLAVERGFTYEYLETMDRHASQVCTTGRSDCGGLALVFAAALRSQGIPARLLVGRWAISAQPGERLGSSAYYQWHIKTEFFADGVGWVPADPAMGLVYDKSAEGLRYFGHDAGDFLTFHVDPDLVVDSVHFGPQTMFCMNGGLGVWVSGRGSVGRMTVRQDWQVRDRSAREPGTSARAETAGITPE